MTENIFESSVAASEHCEAEKCFKVVKKKRRAGGKAVSALQTVQRQMRAAHSLFPSAFRRIWRDEIDFLV